MPLNQDVDRYQALEATKRTISPDRVVAMFQGVDVHSNAQVSEFKTTYDDPLLLEIEEGVGM